MWWWRGRRLRARAYTQSTQTDWQTEWQAQQIITSEERASARSYTSTVAVALYATHQPKLRVSRQKHTRKSKSDRGTQFQMFKRQTKTEWSHNCYEMIQYRDVSAHTQSPAKRIDLSVCAWKEVNQPQPNHQLFGSVFVAVLVCVDKAARILWSHIYIHNTHEHKGTKHGSVTLTAKE